MKLYKLLILIFVAVAIADDEVKVEEESEKVEEKAEDPTESRQDFLMRIGRECIEETKVSNEEGHRLMSSGMEIVNASAEGKVSEF